MPMLRTRASDAFVQKAKDVMEGRVVAKVEAREHGGIRVWLEASGDMDESEWLDFYAQSYLGPASLEVPVLTLAYRQPTEMVVTEDAAS